MGVLLKTFLVSLLTVISISVYAEVKCPVGESNPTIAQAYEAMVSGSEWTSYFKSGGVHMSFVNVDSNPGNEDAKSFYGANKSGVFKIGYNSSAGGWACRRQIILTSVSKGVFKGHLAVELCDQKLSQVPFAAINDKSALAGPLAKAYAALSLDQLAEGADKMRFQWRSNGAIGRFLIPITGLSFTRVDNDQSCKMTIKMRATKRNVVKQMKWKANQGYAATLRTYEWQTDYTGPRQGIYVYQKNGRNIKDPSL